MHIEREIYIIIYLYIHKLCSAAYRPGASGGIQKSIEKPKVKSQKSVELSPIIIKSQLNAEKENVEFHPSGTICLNTK